MLNPSPGFEAKGSRSSHASRRTKSLRRYEFMAEVFSDCTVCQGSSGRPRNGTGGRTCTANKCKNQYKALRHGGSEQVEQVQSPATVQINHEQMPDNMQVEEMNKILGERCCRPSKLAPKRRRSGPGSAYEQEYLILGTFIENDEGDDEDDEDEIVPEPNTYWVAEADLLETIDPADVKKLLIERHKEVLEQIEAACKRRRRRSSS